MDNLKSTLKSIGVENTYINHSNGGLMSIDESMRYPVKTALSGPAAGVVIGTGAVGQNIVGGFFPFIQNIFLVF